VVNEVGLSKPKGVVMISEHRTNRAYSEGFTAWVATKGHPERTMNPYSRNTAQWKQWNLGWNDARRENKKKQQYPILKEAV